MTGSSSTTILIPAAGASSRMLGRDKLLERINGESALRRAALRACESDADEVVVVIRNGQSARKKELRNLEAKIVESDEPADGMAGSLRCGVAAAKHSDALMILLPDMPDIDTEDINAVLEAFENDEIIRAASEDGKPGHPVLIPRALFRGIAALEGDLGAKNLLDKYRGTVRLVRRPGARALLDLDTQEDWELWRSEQATGSNNERIDN